MWDPALKQRQRVFLYLTRQALTRISTPEHSNPLRLGRGQGEVPLPYRLEERLTFPFHPVTPPSGALRRPLQSGPDLHIQ